MAGKAIPCRDHLSQEFPSQSAMARHWGVSPLTLTSRLKRGVPLERALDPARQESGGAIPCRDHLGNEYPSRAAMFRHYGINQTVFKYRLGTAGWSLEKALTTPVTDPDMAGAHACTDHLGNRFPSKKAMCDYWRVPRTVFFARRRKGLPLEQCLAAETRRRPNQENKIRDHLGRDYKNLDAMCQAWDITKNQYMTNIRNGLNLEQALTMRTARPDRPKDHLGTEYPSINAMCRAWGITKTTLRSRLELGWDLKTILEHPEDNSHTIPCKDHEGRAFPNQKAMLDFHHVSYVTFKHRLSRGRSLKDALSPESLHDMKSSDGEHSFPCLAAMLDYWLISPGTYHHRVNRHGMPPEQAVRALYPGRSQRLGLEIRKTDGGFLNVLADGKQCILHPSAYFRELRRRALLRELEDGHVPGHLQIRPVGPFYFHVTGGPAGDGAVMGPDMAFYVLCVERYATKKKGGRDAAG